MILPVSLRWQRVWKICRSGDKRCYHCYELRMREAAKKGWRHFTPITLPPPSPSVLTKTLSGSMRSENIWQKSMASDICRLILKRKGRGICRSIALSEGISSLPAELLWMRVLQSSRRTTETERITAASIYPQCNLRGASFVSQERNFP